MIRFACAGEGDLPAETLAKIQDEGLTPFVTHQVKMDYEYFTAEQILKVSRLLSTLCESLLALATSVGCKIVL